MNRLPVERTGDLMEFIRQVTRYPDRKPEEKSDELINFICCETGHAVLQRLNNSNVELIVNPAASFTSLENIRSNFILYLNFKDKTGTTDRNSLDLPRHTVDNIEVTEI